MLSFRDNPRIARTFSSFCTIRCTLFAFIMMIRKSRAFLMSSFHDAIRVRRNFCSKSYRTVRCEMRPPVNSVVNPFRSKSYVYARWDIKSYHGFRLRAFERTSREKSDKFYNLYFYFCKSFS